jgi:glycosyltransferase involved in cell wall biosynthesis
MLAIGDSSMVVGWVGRLAHEKGPDVMIEALARSESSWRLSMIGDGRERERLTKQTVELKIGDRVVWHGPISNAGAVMPAFDAFVLSSRTEGTPIALFEAMHAGVPIIATQVGGVPDVVTSEHALLVPSEQPDAIALALAEVRRDPPAAARRSERARLTVLQEFSAEAWIAAVEEVYKTVVV